MAPNNGDKPILNLLDQARQAQAAGVTVGALAMVYVGIDTMAWLSLPVGQEKQGRQDFYRWVDTYLTADANQPYQYVGRDVYVHGAPFCISSPLSRNFTGRAIRPRSSVISITDRTGLMVTIWC